jgi:hypothetical protein
MITVPKLISLGAVGAAAVGIFSGIGFLLLTHPQLATPSVDPIPVAQTREGHEVLPPENNETTHGSPLGLPADKVAVSPTLDAADNRDVPGLQSTAMRTALIPSARAIHAKRHGVARHRPDRTMISRLPQTEAERPAPGVLPITERNGAAGWRPDANAGPNPGGGFYSGPNINVGRINP